MKIFKYIKQVRRSIIRFIVVIAAMFCVLESKAQQDPMFTQYMENLLMLNPAYAGSKDVLSMMVVSRNQWVSMPGAPVTRSLSAHSPIKSEKMGLGLSILSDEVGTIKQTGVFFDYSYKLSFSDQRHLSLGLKGGVSFYEAGIADLTTVDPNDPVFANDINQNLMPNLGVGAFYYTNNYYLGFSVPKLIENKINQNGVSTEGVSREEMHAFFMAGYVFDVNRIVKFKPSILTKYVRNAPFSFDFTGTFVFYKRLWLGGTYRYDESFGGLFQIQATDQLKIGYSYELPINELGAYSNGTHEIMVTFDLNFGKGRVRSPRYF